MTDDYDQFTKRMTSFDLVLGDTDPMAHSEDSTNNFLTHYGIKGMKWGVRRKPGPDGTVGGSGTTKATRKEKREARKAARKQSVKENIKRPRSEDAVKAGAARARTKKHGTDALTNQELQAVVQRMNLEQQYTNLKAAGKADSARKAGQTYVADILKDAGRDLAMEAIKWGVRETAKSAANKASSRSSRTTNATRVGQKELEAGRKRLNR